MADTTGPSVVTPEKGETVYYVHPRLSLNSPIQVDPAIVLAVLVDGAGKPQQDMAVDLAVFHEERNKPLAVRRIAVAYHAYKDSLTNPGNTWHFKFEPRMADA